MRALLAAVLAASLTGCTTDHSSFGAIQPSASASSATQPEGDCGPVSTLRAMAAKPAGTAIAENPRLSLLGAALKQAKVLDSLDRAPALTVFAPTDKAFEKLSAAERNDREAMLRTVAKHIVTWRLTPEQLLGQHATLGRTELIVEEKSGIVTVDETATVVCTNVQTTNAVIYVIDAVLTS